MSRKRRKNRPPPRSAWDTQGDLIWKWLLRVAALGAFFYVLIALKGDIPLGFYVLIGGMGGLPHAVSLQQALNRSEAEDEDEEPDS